MIETLKNLKFGTLCTLYIFGLAMFSFQYMHTYMPFNTKTAEAQISEYIGVSIGGETEGVSDLCCNGLVLEFSSISPLSPWILDGEALFVPGLSAGFANGNEYSEGYNTLGTLMPGLCLTISSECYTPEYKITVRTVGTSG